MKKKKKRVEKRERERQHRKGNERKNVNDHVVLKTPHFFFEIKTFLIFT